MTVFSKINRQRVYKSKYFQFLINKVNIRLAFKFNSVILKAAMEIFGKHWKTLIVIGFVTIYCVNAYPQDGIQTAIMSGLGVAKEFLDSGAAVKNSQKAEVALGPAKAKAGYDVGVGFGDAMNNPTKNDENDDDRRKRRSINQAVKSRIRRAPCNRRRRTTTTTEGAAARRKRQIGNLNVDYNILSHKETPSINNIDDRRKRRAIDQSKAFISREKRAPCNRRRRTTTTTEAAAARRKRQIGGLDLDNNVLPEKEIAERATQISDSIKDIWSKVVESITTLLDGVKQRIGSN